MKVINFLFNLIISSGVFMILGTAGGSDMGDVTLSEIFTFTLSGISLISVGHTGKTIIGNLLSSRRKPFGNIRKFPEKRIPRRNIAA